MRINSKHLTLLFSLYHSYGSTAPELLDINKPPTNLPTRQLIEPITIRAYPVDQFGAKGDGTTDDTKAIQSAIFAASKNNIGISFRPTGRYLINRTIEISQLKGVPLFILGDGATLIAGTKMAAVLTIENPQALRSWFRISGLTIDAQNKAAVGLNIHGAQHLVVERLTTRHATYAGLSLQADKGHGIYYSRFVDIQSQYDHHGISVKSTPPTERRANGLTFDNINIHYSNDDGVIIEGVNTLFWRGGAVEATHGHAFHIRGEAHNISIETYTERHAIDHFAVYLGSTSVYSVRFFGMAPYRLKATNYGQFGGPGLKNCGNSFHSSHRPIGNEVWSSCPTTQSTTQGVTTRNSLPALQGP